MRLIDSQMTDSLKDEMRLKAKKMKMQKSLLEAAKRIAKNSMYGIANYIVTNTDTANYIVTNTDYVYLINSIKQDENKPKDEN